MSATSEVVRKEVVREPMTSTASEAAEVAVTGQTYDGWTAVRVEQGHIFHATAFRMDDDGHKFRNVDLFSVTGVTMEKGLYGVSIVVKHADGSSTRINTYEEGAR